MHRTALEGIERVNSGRQIREEDKNFEYHQPSFKFIRVLFSVPLTTWPWTGIVTEVYKIKITEVTAI